MPVWSIAAGSVSVLALILWLNRNHLWKAYYRRFYPNAIIPCAHCPEFIYPGMPVHLPGYADQTKVPSREGAVPYTLRNGFKAWVCCPACADTIADFQGSWQLDDANPGHGKVVRHTSAFEAVLAGGEPVISNGRGDNVPL